MLCATGTGIREAMYRVIDPLRHLKFYRKVKMSVTSASHSVNGDGLEKTAQQLH